MASADHPEPGPESGPEPGMPDLDMTAAEVALGLLDGAERAAALRRMLAEPAFARDVEAWRDRFAVLFAAWPAVTAAPALEQRVMRATEAPASRRWLPVAVGAALAASLLAGIAIGPALRPVAIVAPPRSPASPPASLGPPLLAAIVPTKSGAPVAASYDRTVGEIRLAGAVDVPAGHSAELWAIGRDGTPRALGLLEGAATRLPVATARRALLIGGTTLAISIEPGGGSPTGLPTGPVIATGTLAAV